LRPFADACCFPNGAALGAEAFARVCGSLPLLADQKMTSARAAAPLAQPDLVDDQTPDGMILVVAHARRDELDRTWSD